MNENFDAYKNINPINPEAIDIFRRIVENARIGIFMADASGNLFYVNSAFVNILGYNTKDEVIGLNFVEQFYANIEDRTKFLEMMQKLGFVRDMEIRNTTKEGDTVILSTTSNYLRDNNGKVIGYEGIAHDVTEHKVLEEKYGTLAKAMEQTADHVLITDKEGLIQYVNPAFTKSTGFTMIEALGSKPSILKSGMHDEAFYKKLWVTILGGKIFRSIIINKKKNGEQYYSDQTIAPIIDESGKLTNFISVAKDITDRMLLEKRLEKERQKLEEIVSFDENIGRIRKLDNLVDFVVQKVCEIIQVEKCSIMLVDEFKKELFIKCARGLSKKIIQKTKVKWAEPIAGYVASEGKGLMIQDINNYRKLKKIKSTQYLGKSFMSVPIKLEDKVIGVINAADKYDALTAGHEFTKMDYKILCAMSRELAVAFENVKLFKQLNFLTFTDPLTHIYNYRQFAKSLRYEIRRAERYRKPFCLMMVDVDDFKSYNDEFGHVEGDIVLSSIARMLKDNLRDVDIVCRYAGDEFVVILPETDKTQALKAAEKVRKAISKYDFKKTVTISLGVAVYIPGISAHEFISMADKSLYKVKHKGKNAVFAYESNEKE